MEVYARAARVDLFLNGKKVGSNTLKNSCDTRFKVEYQPGMLETVVYNQKGKEISRNTLIQQEKKQNCAQLQKNRAFRKIIWHLSVCNIQIRMER